MNLDGFSMRPLTLELKNLLVGGRIDKIFQHNKANFTFTIRQPGETYKLKISVAPQNPAIYIAKNSLENLKLPGFLSIFNENVVATGVLMTIFFGAIITVLGPDLMHSIDKSFGKNQNFVFYIIEKSLGICFRSVFNYINLRLNT